MGTKENKKRYKKLYYIGRGYVGNDILFWKSNGGYATDIREAREFTSEEVVEIVKDNENYQAYKKEDCQQYIRPVVDMQYVKRIDTIEDVVLNKIKKRK